MLSNDAKKICYLLKHFVKMLRKEYQLDGPNRHLTLSALGAEANCVPNGASGHVSITKKC